MTEKITVPKFEDLEFGPDVDLETEVILSSTGERIDQAYVDQAVAEVHAARRKRGRPSRSGEGTSPTIRLRLSEAEKADWEEQAELRGISLSEYVRWSRDLAEATVRAEEGDAGAMHDVISLKSRAIDEKSKVRGTYVDTVPRIGNDRDVDALIVEVDDNGEVVSVEVIESKGSTGSDTRGLVVHDKDGRRITEVTTQRTAARPGNSTT